MIWASDFYLLKKVLLLHKISKFEPYLLIKYFLRSEAIVMSFFVTRPKKVTHPRSKVDVDLNWCRTLLYFFHLQLCSMMTECWAIQILKEVVRFLLPRKSQKLEFLAVRINFFWLAASFDVKKLVKSQQKLLAASLKIPQLPSMTIASDRRKYLLIPTHVCPIYTFKLEKPYIFWNPYSRGWFFKNRNLIWCDFPEFPGIFD